MTILRFGIGALRKTLNFLCDWLVTWLWTWPPHRLSKLQSQTAVLFRTPITKMIFFNQGMSVTPRFKPFSYERYTVTYVFTLSLKTMTSNLELNLILPFGRLETKVRLARATRLFSSFNQWNYCFKFWFSLPLPLLKLPISARAKRDLLK